MVSRILRYVGFAEETEYNVDPVPEAEFHVDISEASLDVPSETQIMFDGSIGRGQRLHRPGFYSPEGDVTYAIDISTIGWLFKWALGGYVFTADGGEGTGHNLHELYAVDDVYLPTFATRLGKDVFEHVFSGCVANEIELEVSDEFAQATVSILSAKDARNDLEDVADLKLPDEFPLAFHEVTMNRNDIDVSASVREVTLTVDNTAEAEQGRGLGSRYPYRIPANARNVTLEVTLFFNSMDDFELFWGDADGPSDEGTTEFDMDLTFDAGDDGKLVVEFPRAIYTGLETQPSGRDEIQQVGSVQALLADVTLDDGETIVNTDIYARLENDGDEMVVV